MIVTSPGLDGIFGTADDTEVFLISNSTPDEGLSAPFNSWFTFFGQFFDHGLDLVTKNDSEVVFIPLQSDDPLFSTEPGATNFMLLNRATQFNGQEAQNTTTPFVDQNQTYTSHASHQFFLREYVSTPGGPVATGKLLEGSAGGLATWADIKLQARTVLGIELDDFDIHNVPLVATDAYGNFIPDAATGMPQLVTGANSVLVGNTASPVDGSLGVKTGHAFLNDIAHNAKPDAGEIADNDGLISTAADPQPAGTYDGELLEAHFITGDGRGNENIALTAVHHVFHSEHNRQVDEIMATVLTTGDAAFIAQWQISPGVWDGERLFQAARFATEMQYQHLVFEEFARKVAPNVDAFLAPIGYDVTIDAAITAEFAHVVYRFGHSMLTETVDRYDPNFDIIGNPNGQDPADQHMGLIAAFLNPLAFTQNESGVIGGDLLTADEAAGALVRGLTRQAGNEIDEFVTEALRNNLVGLPLDLATINIARGRDTGVPSLNAARAEFFDMTQDSQLAPYTSWVDFSSHLKHEESVINFIAAYGTHATITSATTLEGKRAAALALVTGIGFAGTEARATGLPERPCRHHRRQRHRPVDRRSCRKTDAVWRPARLDLQFRV